MVVLIVILNAISLYVLSPSFRFLINADGETPEYLGMNWGTTGSDHVITNPLWALFFLEHIIFTLIAVYKYYVDDIPVEIKLRSQERNENVKKELEN